MTMIINFKIRRNESKSKNYTITIIQCFIGKIKKAKKSYNVNKYSLELQKGSTESSGDWNTIAWYNFIASEENCIELL